MWDAATKMIQQPYHNVAFLYEGLMTVMSPGTDRPTPSKRSGTRASHRPVHVYVYAFTPCVAFNPLTRVWSLAA